MWDACKRGEKTKYLETRRWMGAVVFVGGLRDEEKKHYKFPFY